MTGGQPENGLVTSAYLALAVQRALLVEGAPSVGKTALAEALAQTFGRGLIRLQCHGGIDASQAICAGPFNWQILYLRIAEI